MWTSTHSLDTSASADAIFARYRDVATWPEWDAALERMELDGPFATGTTGRMVMLDQPPLPTRLSWVQDGRGFEDETELADAGVVVRVRHELEPLPTGGTRLTHTVRISGPNADTLGPSLGPAITADFPTTMAALVAHAARSAAE